MKFTSMHFFILIAILIVGGIVASRVWSEQQPGEYDQFAQCLKDEGATFFGAFWCPHCQEQKEMFGNSDRLLPYVECSLPDGQNQTQICIDEQIKTYPTWEFADGSRLEGVTPLETLSEKTDCMIAAS